MREQKLGLYGLLEIRDKKTGKLLLSKENLITNGGLAAVAGLLGGTGSAFAYGAVGTGTTAAAVTDTELQSQVDAAGATFSRVTTTVTNDTAQFVSTHTCNDSGGWALTEYALKTSASGGTILNRVVFSAINLAEDNQIEITYRVQVKRASS